MSPKSRYMYLVVLSHHVVPSCLGDLSFRLGVVPFLLFFQAALSFHVHEHQVASCLRVVLSCQVALSCQADPSCLEGQVGHACQGDLALECDLDLQVVRAAVVLLDDKE